MFVKIISAFLITSYIFSTVSANPPKNLGQIANVSENQFNSFAGQSDPCDKLDTTYLKAICDKVAIMMNYISSGSMTYCDKYPKCVGFKIELQKGDGKQGGTVQIQTLLLACNASEGLFFIGRGQSVNGVYGWSTEDGIAYPQQDVPNVFKGKDQVA